MGDVQELLFDPITKPSIAWIGENYRLVCRIRKSGKTVYSAVYSRLSLEYVICPIRPEVNRHTHNVDKHIRMSPKCPKNISGTIGFLIASWLHALAFFLLLGRVGVVTCGMVKGAQTGAYVILADQLWYIRRFARLSRDSAKHRLEASVFDLRQTRMVCSFIISKPDSAKLSSVT